MKSIFLAVILFSILAAGFVTALLPRERIIFYEPSQNYIGMVHYRSDQLTGCRVALLWLDWYDGWQFVPETPFTIGYGEIENEVIPTNPRMECLAETHLYRCPRRPRYCQNHFLCPSSAG